MKYITTRNTGLLLCSVVLVLFSCKEEWLEVKRNRQMIVPATLKDLNLLLTDELIIASDYIALMQISADEYYLSSEAFNALGTPIEKNAYLWQENIYEPGQFISDWDNSYNQVLTANVVLDGLAKIHIDPGNREEWYRVKGGALYLRAKASYNLAQTFAKPFDPVTAVTDPGIPLRTTPDVNLPTTRSSVTETYVRILDDLKQSVRFLPSVAGFKTDASKAGAYGLLARCYLSMSDYIMAEVYADSSLSEYNTLIDYNTLNPDKLLPFTRFNEETIQFGQISPLYSVFVFLNQNFVLPELYNEYHDNDLRKVLMFHDHGNGNYVFKGSYEGGVTPFTGVSTDELFLIRAECRARSGNVDGAMEDVNTLLINRFKTGTFVPYTATSASEALDIILKERRKELIGRGLRWTDLRRLNKDPQYATTLVRNVNGEAFTLEPNDPRYVFAIPQYVIDKAGITQNVR